MKDFKVIRGVYPTMITPYKNGEIDRDAVRALVRFYWKADATEFSPPASRAR